MYVPIVDLGATNVAQTAPRTSVVAAAAKISVLIDVGAALVWTSGLSAAGIVLYIVVSMIVGIACAAIVRGSFSDQAGHFGSSWPGGGERPPIRYEDSWGGLRGPSDTQLLIYSYIKR